MGSYSELFRDQRANQPEEEKPEAEDGQCYGGGRGRPVSALTIQHVGQPWESLQYVYLGVRSTFEPTRFVVPFEGKDETYQLIVKGRALHLIYDRIIQSRLGWIRVAERAEFVKDGEPVITSIEVVKVEAD